MLAIFGAVQEAGCPGTEQNPCVSYCIITLSEDNCAYLLLTIKFSTEKVTAAYKTLFIQIAWKQNHEKAALYRITSF